MDLVIRSFSFERQPRIFNYSPDQHHAGPRAPKRTSATTSAILGGFTEPSDPDLKGQYLNEYISATSARSLPTCRRRHQGRSIASTARSSKTSSAPTTAPTASATRAAASCERVFTLDYSQIPGAEAEAHLQGRAARRHQALLGQLAGSRLLHLLEARRQLRRRVRAVHQRGADPEHLGGLRLLRLLHQRQRSLDRDHQPRAALQRPPAPVQALGHLRDALQAVGRAARPTTGRARRSPATATPTPTAATSSSSTERGAEGRTPSTYEADLHLGYPLDGRDRRRSISSLDVFNLLNAQRAILLDQRWGFQEADNASPTPVNPDYKKPVLRTPPRSLRVGVRVSF